MKKNLTPAQLERLAWLFTARFDRKSDDECWEWKGNINNHGYGRVKFDKKIYSAHRLSYKHFNGLIPEGLLVCHKCDNRKCVNPHHLFLGTIQDNAKDRNSKNRQFKPKGTKHPNCFLDPEQVIEIRSRALQGENQKELAREFGISQGHVSDIKLKKTWGHLS